MPLIVEALALAGMAFFAGVLLAYLVVLRRRSAVDRSW